MEYQPQGPVRWFEVLQLVRSGSEAAKATEFARYADGRESQAEMPDEVYDFSTVTGAPFVVDYVADTGDGFDATFAIAQSVNGKASGQAAPQHRAHLLVLGGDEVYPVASVENYQDRLIGPFEDAAGQGPAGGFVVALPGNHDWYDGLVSFRRNFCESWIDRLTGHEQVAPGSPPPAWTAGDPRCDTILGRRLFQSRSYWAVKLPHGWWLWGLDSQLDSYVDASQLAYFLRARKEVRDHERVILCTARPSWTDDPKLDKGLYTSNREVLTWFVNRVFGADDVPAGASAPDAPADRVRHVPLLLSGDKHHYTHYQRQDPTNPSGPEHLVTCGGGGAYLSSTHHAADMLTVPWHLRDGDPSTYRRGVSYPSMEDSKALRWRFWRIPLCNGTVMPALVGGIDLGLAATLAWLVTVGSWQAWTIWALLKLLLTATLTGISVAFRPKARSAGVSMIPGVVHALAHGALAYGGARLALAWGTGNALADLVCGLLVVVGALVLFATYFLVCDLDPIHWHENEFFSAMRIEDYKSHLRITISPPPTASVAGDLTVQVLGIQHPPRHQATARFYVQAEVGLVETFTVKGS